MKRLIIPLVLLVLMTVLPVSAQGEFIIDSDAEPLDSAPIMEAAQPLLDRGATVVVYFAESGEADDFVRRLQDDDLMRGNLIDDTVIAVYVSLGDRYSEIRYGDRWAGILNPRAEGIKSAALDSNLREGVYTRAFSRALEEIETAIAGPNAPPIVPPRRITPPDNSSDSSFNWMILIIIGLSIYSVLRKMGIFTGLIDDSPGPMTAPRFKSSWSSGHRSSSGRSSISRSSSSSGRSFGGGGRSGGKW